MSGIDDTQELQDIQNAYEGAFYIQNAAAKCNQQSKMSLIFAFAAGIGLQAFIPNPMVFPLVVNSIIIYDSWRKREASKKLKQDFENATQSIGPEGRQHLRSLGQELKTVKDFNLDDINPIKQFQEKNYVGPIMSLASLLFMPAVLPAILSQSATTSDAIRNGKLVMETEKIKQDMERRYGSQLQAPNNAP